MVFCHWQPWICATVLVSAFPSRHLCLQRRLAIPLIRNSSDCKTGKRDLNFVEFEKEGLVISSGAGESNSNTHSLAHFVHDHGQVAETEFPIRILGVLAQSHLLQGCSEDTYINIVRDTNNGGIEVRQVNRATENYSLFTTYTDQDICEIRILVGVLCGMDFTPLNAIRPA